MVDPISLLLISGSAVVVPLVKRISEAFFSRKSSQLSIKIDGKKIELPDAEGSEELMKRITEAIKESSSGGSRP